MALVAYASNPPEAHGSRMLAWSRDRGYNDAAVCLSNEGKGSARENWSGNVRIGDFVS